MFRASRGACPVDVTVAGGESCGTQYCRQGQRQHDRASFKKNILKPHLKEQWVIPPKANSAFVAAMEDVLEVYHRRTIPTIRWFVLTSRPSNLSKKRAPRSR